MLAAQSTGVTTADLKGTVVGATGLPGVGARVVLTHGATGQAWVATTDTNGNWAFRLLPPGDYRLTATRGDEIATGGLSLQLGASASKVLRLRPIGSDEILVEAALEDSGTQVSMVVGHDRIANLPINKPKKRGLQPHHALRGDEQSAHRERQPGIPPQLFGHDAAAE